MIKQGNIVKLRNPRNKREAKRRWEVTGKIRIERFNTIVEGVEGITPYWSEPGFSLCRLDTATHRIERLPESCFVPLSWWERLMRRVHGQ